MSTVVDDPRTARQRAIWVGVAWLLATAIVMAPAFIWERSDNDP